MFQRLFDTAPYVTFGRPMFGASWDNPSLSLALPVPLARTKLQKGIRPRTAAPASKGHGHLWPPI